MSSPKNKNPGFGSLMARATNRGSHSETRIVRFLSVAERNSVLALACCQFSQHKVTSVVTFRTKWVLLGIELSFHCTASSKLCKKGKLCLFAAPSANLRLPKPRNPSFQHRQRPAFHALPTPASPIVRQLAPFPEFSPARPEPTMPQLTSSFASAAAGQNRDSRGSGRTDSNRGSGSGDW